MSSNVQVEEKIANYLRTKTISVERQLRHGLADTFLDRARFSFGKKTDGRHEEHAEYRFFGDHVKFLDYICDAVRNPEKKKPILVLGESGLGKTWLMLRSWLGLADRWPRQQLLPVYLSLRGETLALDPEVLDILNDLSVEKADRLRQGLASDPVENLEKRVAREVGFDLAKVSDLSVVLLFDGMNEMPLEGRRNLLHALDLGFSNALWVISGQPQAAGTMKEQVGKKQGSEQETLSYDRFRIKPISNPDRLKAFLKTLLPQELVPIAMSEYFHGLSTGIRRNPRYLDMICENIRRYPYDISQWPRKLGQIFDRAIGDTLQEYLTNGAVHQSEIPTRLSVQKIILGCLGIYETLAKAPLHWENGAGKNTVWKWLGWFEKAGVLPDGRIWKEELDRLQKSGPWGGDGSGRVIFDHDTTRDYAVAYLISHLLQKWPAGTYEGFREWIVLALLIHPGLGKSLGMIVDLVEYGSLELADAANLGVPEEIQLSEHAFNHPDVKRILLDSLEDKDAYLRGKAVYGLAGALDDPSIRSALLLRLEDDDEWVRLEAVCALAGALDDPSIRNALLLRLEDDERWVRLEAVCVLAGALDDPSIRSALLSRLEDDDDWVRLEAVSALAGALDDPSIRKALLLRLEDDDRWVRLKATKAVAGAIDDPSVRISLVLRLEDEDPGVRRIATKVLAPIFHDPFVRNAIMQRVEDTDASVRTVALKVLLGAFVGWSVRFCSGHMVSGLARRLFTRRVDERNYLRMGNHQTSLEGISCAYHSLTAKRLIEAILRSSAFTSSSQPLQLYAFLHHLRHQSKHSGNLFMDELFKYMPVDGIMHDLYESHENMPALSMALHYLNEDGGSFVPFFNVGTFALAVLGTEKSENGQSPGETFTNQEKEEMLDLFMHYVCNLTGFRTFESIKDWMTALWNNRRRAQFVMKRKAKGLEIVLENHRRRAQFVIEVIWSAGSGAYDNHYTLGDREVFRHCILQLAKNALSYAAGVAKVVVLTYPAKDPTILVVDDGPGIDPSNVERCFTGWTSRADNKGEGLGLCFQIPYKLKLMGFSLYVRDNQGRWHWIRSNDGYNMDEAARKRNPLPLLPDEDRQRIESRIPGMGAAFLIVQGN